MNTFILGISAFYHDSAACIMKNGVIIHAAQEERFTRKKNDASFPINAINFCLQAAEININEIELVVFYEKPFLKFDRIIDTFSRKTPKGFLSFKKAIKSWVSEKIWIPNIIQKQLNYSGEILFTEHHEAHAASAFFASPFSEATILTIDGVGEKASISIYKGKDNQISPISEQRFPHSLGLLYSAFTYYCGFKVNSGEYKLMGLAPYGVPKYKEIIYKHLITISNDGILQLNMTYFNFEAGLTMINKKFEQLFQHPKRTSEGNIDQFYKDIAASIQEVLEECVLIIAKHAVKTTNINNLCLAGGVALNCKVNQHLSESYLFDAIWVQPASGDSGGCIGATYLGYYHYLKRERIYYNDSPKNHVYLGNQYTNEQIEAVLKERNLVFKELNTDELLQMTAQYLMNNQIIGWFQGAMEFGPRALGNRSILASPLNKDMQQHLNLKIKKRESFRPFAPVVLNEKANEWFSAIKNAKYMLFTYQAKEALKIPSCVHLDGSSRVQTVQQDDHYLLHKLIKEFEKLSGVPMLINTSFNERGEPIVATINDAIHCFFNTDMDYLVLGNYILSKKENSAFSNHSKTKKYALD